MGTNESSEGFRASYDTGYWANGTGSEIFWNTSSQYNSLTFSIGCPDDRHNINSLEIYGDGLKIGGTPELGLSDRIRSFVFDVSGVNILLVKSGRVYAPIIHPRHKDSD